MCKTYFYCFGKRLFSEQTFLRGVQGASQAEERTAASLLSSAHEDHLTSSLFHFDHFKDSLEVHAGESPEDFCRETDAIVLFAVPSAVTQDQTEYRCRRCRRKSQVEQKRVFSHSSLCDAVAQMGFFTVKNSPFLLTQRSSLL